MNEQDFKVDSLRGANAAQINAVNANSMQAAQAAKKTDAAHGANKPVEPEVKTLASQDDPKDKKAMADMMQVKQKGEDVQKALTQMTDNMKQNAEALVKSVNSALSYAKENDSKQNKLLDDIYGMNQTYGAQLKDMGINVNQDGSVAVDSDKLAQAANDGGASNQLNSSAYANRAGDIAEKMQQNSASYVNKATSQKASTGQGMALDVKG